MNEITSAQNPLIKKAASLAQKKYRDELHLFVVEGEAPLLGALAQGWELDSVFVLEEKNLALTGHDEKIFHVPQHLLEKISHRDNPQPVIGLFRQRVTQTLPDNKQPTLLALEEVRDPGNLGTIIRTCHALGLKDLLLVGFCCDPYAPECIRATRGSFANVQLNYFTRDDFLKWLQSSKRRLLVTDVTDAADYRETDYSDTVLVLGNEQRGVSREIMAVAGARVHIPMPGGTESLNVATAGALLLYEALRNKI